MYEDKRMKHGGYQRSSTVLGMEIVRNRRKWSRKWVAHQIGCSPGWIAQVEGGIRQPSWKFRMLISQLFGLPEDKLFSAWEPEAKHSSVLENRLNGPEMLRADIEAVRATGNEKYAQSLEGLRTGRGWAQ